MSLVYEYRDKVPGGVHLDMSNELQAIWTMWAKTHASGPASITYETIEGHETINGDVFTDLDSYIFHVNTAMGYDSEYFEWCKDVKVYLGSDNTRVPEKYYNRCTAYFLEATKNLTYIPLGRNAYTLQGLRESGLQINEDDETFYKQCFIHLDSLYQRLIYKEMLTADYYWEELCNTPGHENLLRLIQQGERSVFWRHVWSLQRSNRRIDNTASVCGANVAFQRTLVHFQRTLVATEAT